MQVGRITHIDTARSCFAFSTLADQVAAGAIVKVILPDHDNSLALFAVVVNQVKRIAEQPISPSQRQQVDSGHVDVWAIPFAYGDPGAMVVQSERIAEYVSQLRRMDIVILCEGDVGRTLSQQPALLKAIRQVGNYEELLHIIGGRP